jgi:FG-GAP repeat
MKLNMISVLGLGLLFTNLWPLASAHAARREGFTSSSGEEAHGADVLLTLKSSNGSRMELKTFPRNLLSFNGSNDSKQNRGHRRLQSETDWTQIGNEIYGEGNALLQGRGDGFGWSVTMSADGSRMAVGAPLPVIDLRGLPGPGYVRIFKRGTYAWEQVGNTIYGDNEDGYDLFGLSVDMSADGSRVVVGAPNSNGLRINTVRVFDEPTGSDSNWIQIGNTINGVALHDNFGWSVAMSADGNRVAVGAPASNEFIGSVRVFEEPTAGLDSSEWSQIGSDLNGDSPSGIFGWSVAMSVLLAVIV